MYLLCRKACPSKKQRPQLNLLSPTEIKKHDRAHSAQRFSSACMRPMLCRFQGGHSQIHYQRGHNRGGTVKESCLKHLRCRGAARSSGTPGRCCRHRGGHVGSHPRSAARRWPWQPCASPCWAGSRPPRGRASPPGPSAPHTAPSAPKPCAHSRSNHITPVGAE